MKTRIKILGLLAMISISGVSIAQTNVDYVNRNEPDKMIRQPFSNKFYWGLGYNQLWSTIKGNSLPKNYFTKASIGFSVSAEYFPISFIGISAGVGYQQRGAGISNPNKLPVTGLSPDSTHRERLRFNTFEFPIGIILRTPKDLIKGLRFAVSAAIVPMVNIKSNDVFVNVEAVIRDQSSYTNVSSDYFKSDIAYQLTFGPEIDSGGSGLFRFHFLYSRGTKNVYAQNQGNGVNQTVGFRVAWLFGANHYTKDYSK